MQHTKFINNGARFARHMLVYTIHSSECTVPLACNSCSTNIQKPISPKKTLTKCYPNESVMIIAIVMKSTYWTTCQEEVWAGSRILCGILHNLRRQGVELLRIHQIHIFPVGEQLQGKCKAMMTM